MTDTTRIQLELLPSHMERLRRLKEKTESASYAEVTRKALKLYAQVVDGTLVVRHPDGSEKEFLVL